MPQRQEAETFFAELEQASAVARVNACGASAVSPWGDAAWPSSSGPSGIILHYTTGNSFRGSVDWLCTASYATHSSAHVVVGRTREAWADQGVKKGGQLDALSASVVQTRLPSQTAWHATWANPWAIGIELASCGEIRKDAKGQWVGPNGDWTERVSDTSTVYSAGGRTWHGFTDAQVRTTVYVMQMYAAMFPSVTRENVLGHEHVQGVRTPERPGCDKRDLGIGVRLGYFRDSVFPDAEGEWRDNAAEALACVLIGNAGRAETQADRESWAAMALGALGYAVDGGDGKTTAFAPTRARSRRSLYIAQRMLGLVPDMVVGPKTVAALRWRLEDRFGPR